MLNINIGDTVCWYVPTTCPCGNAYTRWFEGEVVSFNERTACVALPDDSTYRFVPRKALLAHGLAKVVTPSPQAADPATSRPDDFDTKRETFTVVRPDGSCETYTAVQWLEILDRSRNLEQSIDKGLQENKNLKEEVANWRAIVEKSETYARGLREEGDSLRKELHRCREHSEEQAKYVRGLSDHYNSLSAKIHRIKNAVNDA